MIGFENLFYKSVTVHKKNNKITSAKLPPPFRQATSHNNITSAKLPPSFR